MTPLSPRLAAIVAALPVRPDSRVLEIGCGPGAAARAVAAQLATGHILAIDRSPAAVAQARAAAAREIAAGRMDVRHAAAEDLVLHPGEKLFDLVFAVRVGALDGRHPAAGEQVLQRIALATTDDARLFIDGGDPLRELPIPRAGSPGPSDSRHLPSEG
jgi:SAM-dependent methyltransferase